MSDSQRDQIAAATEIFERVLRGYAQAPPNGNGNGNGNGARPRSEQVQLAQLRTAAARTLDLYSQLVQETLEAVAHLADDLVPGLGDDDAGPLTLSGPAGADAVVPVWIHNATDLAVGGVRLRLTDLVAPTGARVAGALARFAPAVLDIAPRGSGESRLSLPVPRDAAPGLYHGHLLAPELPEAALAVRLEVER